MAEPAETTLGKKPEHKSERLENIVAISVFAVLIIIVLALFTNGFGLLNKSKNTDIDTTTRVQVDVSNAPIRGNSGAKVLIVAFSDFQCDYCKSAESKMNSIIKEYDGKVVYAFKQFPLEGIHEYAFNASLAAKCAQEQDRDKYWEYHDYLFEHNDLLGVPYLEEYAKYLGFKTEQFDSCLEEKKYAFEVENDIRDGRKAGVSSTPTFLINGIKVIGNLDKGEFTKIIDSELNK